MICLGGDGTPFEVINGIYAKGRPPRTPEIGLIPAGTGNSFLRDFDTLTADQALDNIVAGRRHAVDLVDFAYRQNGLTEHRFLPRTSRGRSHRRHPQIGQQNA